MARNPRPEDYNAFGYDPHGRIANAAGMLFGTQWRPDDHLPRHPQAAPPRYGPPADYQVPHLPPNFAPQFPPGSYLAPAPYQPYHPAYPAFDPATGIPYPPKSPPPHARQPDRANRDGPPPLPHVSVANVDRAPTSSTRKPASRGDSRHKDEVRPGVYRFDVFVLCPGERKSFTIHSDIEWWDLYSRACANLEVEPKETKLGYRIALYDGKTAPPGDISTEGAFRDAMRRICDVISRSRSKTYEVELVDMDPPKREPIAQSSKGKSKKRSRDDDIPNDENNDEMLSPHFKELLSHTKCEACKGNCFITSTGVHQRLSIKDLTYWAKDIALGNSNRHVLPSAISLDRRPKRTRLNPRLSSGSSTEIHVHLDGLGPGLQFGGSVLGNKGGSESSDSKSAIVEAKQASKEASPPPYTSNFLSVPEITIEDVLAALEVSDSGKNFIKMLKPLQEANIFTLDDIISRSPGSISQWTGLPPSDIELVARSARNWKILGDIVKNSRDSQALGGADCKF